MPILRSTAQSESAGPAAIALGEGDPRDSSNLFGISSTLPRDGHVALTFCEQSSVHSAGLQDGQEPLIGSERMATAHLRFVVDNGPVGGEIREERVQDWRCPYDHPRRAKRLGERVAKASAAAATVLLWCGILSGAAQLFF